MIRGIKEDLENERFYEAYQKYLHFVNRMLQHDQYDKTILIAVSGIKTLLKYEQVELGKELSMMLIKAFQKQNNMSYKYNQYQMNALELLEEILKLFKDETRERVIILYESLKLWEDKTEGGHPKLRLLLAQTLNESKDFSTSHNFFIGFSGHEEEHAGVVFEWMKEGHDWEVDYFITKAVLQKLREKNDIPSSKKLLNEMLKLRAEKTKENEISPILRFLTYLILSLEKKKPELLRYVFMNYKKFLEQDTLYFKYLSQIHQKNFKGETNFFEGQGAAENSFAGMLSMIPQLLGSLNQQNKEGGNEEN